MGTTTERPDTAWWQDHGTLRADVLRWLGTLRSDDGTPAWRYNRHMIRPWAVESTCDAIKILDHLGAVDEIPLEDRQAIGDFLVATQDPQSGWCVDRLAIDEPMIWPKDRLFQLMHATGVVIQALPKLGCGHRLRHQVRHPDMPRDPAAVPRWLAGFAWDMDPWGAGSRVGQSLLFHRSNVGLVDSAEEDPVMTAALDWLEAHQDPATGLWGTDRGGQVAHAVPGLHCLSVGTYYLPCRPLRRPETIIDTVLSLQQPDGNFGAGGGCQNYDAVRAFDSAGRYTAHRRDEAVAATARLVERILATYRKEDGAFSFEEGHCMTSHCVAISEPLPESDTVGTQMYLWVLRAYARMRGAAIGHRAAEPTPRARA